jgi:putative ABC transport system ATP-binding protein
LESEMPAATNPVSTGLKLRAEPVAPAAWLPSQPAEKTLMLETRNLTRAIRKKMLVSDISIGVQPGEILAVVGPSGAGKSSFLRLLNRLDEPTAGTVLLNGRDYRTIAPRELRRRVGMVMQMACLFPGTVAANVAFGPLQRRETMVPKAIAALLDRVGLPGYQDRDVGNLSGGEAQRVSVARTIVKERSMTCVMVTHNMLAAARIAARTMLIDAGKLVAIGQTKEVLSGYRIVE